MDWFPENVYSDIRSEEKNSTMMAYHKNNLDTLRIRKDHGGYLRIFDGKRWFAHATTIDLLHLDKDLISLEKLTNCDLMFHRHPRISIIPSIQQSLTHYQQKEYCL